MTDLIIVILYNGSWSSENRYEGHKNLPVLCPKSADFQWFRNCVYQTLKKDERFEQLVLRYQLSPGFPPTDINDDSSLRVYLELNSRSNCHMNYPLCVSVFPEDSDNQVIQGVGAAVDDLLEVSDAVMPGVENVDNEHNAYIRILSSTTMEVISQSSDDCIADDVDLDVAISDHRIRRLEVNQIFLNKKVLMRAMVWWSTRKHRTFQYQTYKSCPRQYYLRCKDNLCPWMMNASKKQNADFFVIRKYDPQHTCSVDTRCGAKRQLNAKVVGMSVMSKYVRHKRKYTPGDIIADVREMFSETITYRKAWRSKEIALRMLMGTPKESYKRLPSFLYMMEKMNPGSFVQRKSDEQGRFVYLFFALAASLQGWMHCRPVVVVDATFLRSCYGGTLMSAVGQDALGMIYPLAFGIMDGENDASWNWFFTQFRAAYGDRPGLVVVSDRHKSIEKASKSVFPSAPHCICMVHLLQNLKSKFKNNIVEMAKYFKKACKAYTDEKFDTYITQLRNINKKIPGYLQEAGYAKWSRLHSPMPRYNVLTSNIAECLNAVNKDAKNLPITSLVQYLRDTMQQLFQKNRHIAASTFTRLATYWERKLEKRYELAGRMEVMPAVNNVAKVSLDGVPFIVDMGNKTCTCNGFQIDDMPCAHALAYIKHFNLNSYDYCSQYYFTENMVAAYSGGVYPVAAENTWVIPEHVRNEILLPPLVKNRAGRPKITRIRNPWERKTTTASRCSVCRGEHHNRRTCTGVPT